MTPSGIESATFRFAAQSLIIQWVLVLNGKGVALTTHHLPPRLRMSWVIPPIPHTPSWCARGQLYTSFVATDVLPVNCVREWRVLEGRVAELLESDVPLWRRIEAEREITSTWGGGGGVCYTRKETKTMSFNLTLQSFVCVCVCVCACVPRGINLKNSVLPRMHLCLL